MQDLRVTGVEDGALVLADENGNRYRVEVDETHLSQLRRARISDGTGDRRVAPREVQAHIRAGMSAEDVATLTGATLEYIARFEGPVLAEREYIVESALNVAVHTAGETDPANATTFGQVIRTRLADGGALDERWAGWKDAESGWVVKLTFTAESVEHDARWSFDPRKSSLSPLNAEAISLSQQGDVPPSLIPRLRAVNLDDRNETGRFDSGAFSIEDGDLAGPFAASAPPRPDAGPAKMNQTADLLEALRRRRGERDAVVFDPEEPAHAAHPSTGTIRLVDVPLDGFTDDDEDADPANTGEVAVTAFGGGAARPSQGAAKPAARKPRASMPSWDEIVFGARTEDD